MSRTSQPRAFDPGSGNWSSPHFPDQDVVERASVSPWADAQGRSRVAARWTSRFSGPEVGFGVACYGFPDGRLVDRVATNFQVAGPPCWFPDRSSRVLFPAWDGALYRVAFEDDGDDPGPGPAPANPSRVNWTAGRPEGRVMIMDAVWPDDPAWGGRLFVTVNVTRAVGGRMLYTGTHVWWLELNAAATAVLRAGRVTRPGSDPVRADTSALGVAEERCPTLATVPGVGPVMAYLWKPAGRDAWEVRVVTLAADPATGAPLARPETARSLVAGCGFLPPVFSPDGRRVFVLMDPLLRRAHMEPFPVTVAAPPDTPAVARHEG